MIGDVCRRVRGWDDVPIVVLSADGSEDRKVDALNGGYLKVYAYRIRRKLGDESGSFLQSDPSVGYRLARPETR